MRRRVHIPSLIALAAVSLLTGGGLWWLWQRSLVVPGEIRCSTSGYSAMACNTDFGNYATAVIIVAAPLIARLFHRAFFSRFTKGR